MTKNIDGDRLSKFRLILIGNTKVGKTAFINQFINNKFINEYYPTSVLTIYRKLYNFNPGEHQTDDLYYVELLDTMGYDYSKTIKEHNEFVGKILLEEKDISSNAEYNLKIPNGVLNNIHYEYLPQQKSDCNMRINLGLFSKSDVMAYLFMFDYANDASLDEMLEVYKKIDNAEESKTKSKENSEMRQPVKVFICNKYLYKVRYEESIAEYATAVKRLMEEDIRTKEIVGKIERVIEQSKGSLTGRSTERGAGIGNVKEKRMDSAKGMIFFTNAQCNSTVRNAMNYILMKIIQKRKLWEGKAFEDDKGVKKRRNKGRKKVKERGGFGGMFSICRNAKWDNYSDDDNDYADNNNVYEDDDDDNNNNDNEKEDAYKKGNNEKEDSSDDEVDQPKRFNHFNTPSPFNTNKDSKDKDKETKDNDETSPNCLII